MIGYFGDIVFETNDKKILNFRGLKRKISASYSDHGRIGKKPLREFNAPENQGVSFEMHIKAGHGVKPRATLNKLTTACEKGEVRKFVLGGYKVGGGNWTIDSIDATYDEVWNRGELVSVTISVTATEYR